MNLIVAFAVSLKHKLRFEPYTNYNDLRDLVDHLDTLAEQATNERLDVVKKQSVFKRAGEHLGLTFAQSNPRKEMKKATSPLGNLPLEILCYLSAYIDSLVENGQLPVPMQQTTACTSSLATFAINMALVNESAMLTMLIPQTTAWLLSTTS